MSKSPLGKRAFDHSDDEESKTREWQSSPSKRSSLSLGATSKTSLENITPPSTPTRRSKRSQGADNSENILTVDTTLGAKGRSPSAPPTPKTPTRPLSARAPLDAKSNARSLLCRANSNERDENVKADVLGKTGSSRVDSVRDEMGPFGYYQNAKALFKRTTEPHRLVGRSDERKVIRSFYEDHILTPKGGALYISGQPGTGKTALLKEIMYEMAPKLDAIKHDVKSVFINCMTIQQPRAVYQRVMQELGRTLDSTKQDAVKALEEVVLEPSKKVVMYMVVLDEIDHLLTKNQDVLYKLFEWCSVEGSRLVLFGIANALDMTDRFLPRLKARHCEPQLLNFNPYQVAEIQAIIMDRLASLEKTGPSHPRSSEPTDGEAKPSVVPLMQKAAIEFCARKVAAATGDLRKALDICRQTIEMVEAEAKKKDRQERQQQQLQSRALPLSEIQLGDAENRVAGGADVSILSQRHAKPATTTAAASAAMNELQDLPKVTVVHVKKALASAFGSPAVQKMKALNVHQKIVLAVLVMKIQDGKAKDCEVGKVFDQYTTTCRASNKIGAVNRGEYQDLINMLEANGLITLSKAKEERLRKIGLVPRESEVVEAIKGQDILSAILSKAGLTTTEA
ncbi:AAA ATPase [Mortierella sp. NVP85]|nr:AAA ATPase [Mortierella sp. NVP85]